MLLMIDNYDSFTYNLVQYLRGMETTVEVYRNDALTVDQVASLDPAGIVISPGPGRPADAGISVEVIKRYAGAIPILGVCLGHQAIGEAFGGKVTHAKKIMHGKTSRIQTDGKGVFRGMKRPFDAMRYHSLVVDRATLPDVLEVTAETEDDGEIMGIRHQEYSVEGIQFHPESIMTTVGKRILRNFLEITNEHEPAGSG
jgi:anthranilate synthase/aminodeoxychorismate synthase-like glutamine amidotransferase